MMNKGLAAFGLSALAWSLMLAPATAKIIQYEINGRYYTYDSTRPEQIAVARKLIEAANAADQAQAIADAERAANPLAAIFGSKAQEAALAAKAHLERALAEESQATVNAVAQPASPSPRAEPEREPARAASAARPARPEQRTESAKPSAAVDAPRATRDESTPARTAEDFSGSQAQSVFLDQETGIRTTFMPDGSIREEMADATVLSEEAGTDGSDRLAGRQRNESSPATTGSTTPRKADPTR